MRAINLREPHLSPKLRPFVIGFTTDKDRKGYLRKQKTQVMESHNPIWTETLIFPVLDRSSDVIVLQLKSKGKFTDDLLGEITVPIRTTPETLEFSLPRGGQFIATLGFVNRRLSNQYFFRTLSASADE